MSVKNIVKSIGPVQDLNRYRKYVGYVLKRYKSDKRHSLISVVCAVGKALARHVSTKEFCYLHYMDLPDSEQRNIVPWAEQVGFYERVNTEAAGTLLCNKFSTYERFKEYYKRELCYVAGEKERDRRKFVDFARRNGRIVVKPIDANKGFGVRVVDVREMSVDVIEQVLNGYPYGAVVESLIVQSDKLGAFHPQSVNTIRVNTIRYDDGVEVKWPCLRIGRGGSVVDNAGAGGVFAAIDETSGVTLGVADEKGNDYTHHPDTGLPLVGFTIPEWDKVCSMAKELAMMIPENRFTGWDFALTEQGWLLVEGNYMPLIIWQIAAHKGIRPDFERMRKRVLDT